MGPHRDIGQGREARELLPVAKKKRRKEGRKEGKNKNRKRAVTSYGPQLLGILYLSPTKYALQWRQQVGKGPREVGLND